MFDLLEDRIRPRVEPRRWHAWFAAVYAFLTPALAAKFAWRHSAAIIQGTPGGYTALAFASAVAVVTLTAWACSLTGRIRAHKAYAIAMLCFFVLLEISWMTR